MTESSRLKMLLNTWGLAELLPHLQDESIGIDELKMMKNHHIVELLRTYKLGIRIRFEYYFERWRRDQNKPLIDVATPSPCHSTCSSVAQTLHTANLAAAAAPQEDFISRKKLQSRATNTVTVRYATVATNTSDLPALTVPKTNDIIPPAPPIVNDPLRDMPKPLSHPSMLDERLMAASTPSRMPTTMSTPTMTMTATTTTPNTCSTRQPPKLQFNINDFDTEPTDTAQLMYILNSSGSKGNSLIEYYKTHQQLMNTHRTVLIQLIVNFFDLNDYHLPLRISHSLEQQILKLFPSEKLEYYRTEKRGKIYVKFCNMKRYKRDKSLLKRKWTEDGDYGDESGGGGGVSVDMLTEPKVGIECDDDEMDDYAQRFEYWHTQQSPARMHVKTESLSDDDY